MKQYNWRTNKQLSSGVNDYWFIRYWEWRMLPWYKRLLTRRPQSNKLFCLK